jgi:hypothetical protein
MPGQNSSRRAAWSCSPQVQRSANPARWDRLAELLRRELRRAPSALRVAEQVDQAAVVGTGGADVDVATLLEGVAVEELVGTQTR